MKILLTGILILLASGCATTTSHQVGAQFGLGKAIVTNHFGIDKQQFERSAGVSYQFNFSQFYVKPRFGGWLAFGEGRKHSFIASSIVGVRVAVPMGFVVQTGIGPAFISHPDSALSTHFQFDIELAAGFQWGRAGIMALYGHDSNAGIRLPNRGNDFFGGYVYYRFGYDDRQCKQ